jgi:hypothetical protein
MQRLIFAASALAAGLMVSAPALAQDAGEKVNQLIIYGDDPCPASAEGEITVCARKDEGERYRIPAPLRESQSPSNESWNNKVLAYETVGRSGTLSCSPVGPGGWTGCANQLIDTAYAEKRESTDVRFGQLIAEERARRLLTIDSDAAETQARVEVLERQIEARQKAQAEVEDSQSSATSLPVPPGK